MARGSLLKLWYFCRQLQGFCLMLGRHQTVLKESTCSSKNSKMIWWTIKPLPRWELNWHAYLETLRNTDSRKGDLWLCEGHLCSKIHVTDITAEYFEKSNCARYYWEIIKPIWQRPLVDPKQLHFSQENLTYSVFWLKSFTRLDKRWQTMIISTIPGY